MPPIHTQFTNSHPRCEERRKGGQSFLRSDRLGEEPLLQPGKFRDLNKQRAEGELVRLRRKGADLVQLIGNAGVMSLAEVAGALGCWAGLCVLGSGKLRGRLDEAEAAV